jgi:beta-1,2-mannobiose phosphorylase / 1,2-beta-oligomannan phosphorylase
LNPAIIQDPDSNILHMLFRATGPWPQKNLKGKCDPYPIFLGYARSEDRGRSWKADFERPALEPALEYEVEKMYIQDDEGQRVVNYANGCIEDPRIFEVEGQLYVSVASRMFPPGPYWLGDKRRDNCPDWAYEEKNPFGIAASLNDTTTVLYRLDLNKLKNREYQNAFTYVSSLTDCTVTDNRDVFLFPEKMKINGKMQYLMLHRPHHPDRFETGEGVHKPSMFLAAAENIREFTSSKAQHKLLATIKFDWEDERIGASWPPIRLEGGEWLVSYHGKQYPGYGYSQSFMILKEKENDFPEIVHRCSERLMYAQQDWEMPDKFACPCIFSTGGIVVDGKLIISYGAADQKVGIAWVDFNELVHYIKHFDADGNRGG